MQIQKVCLLFIQPGGMCPVYDQMIKSSFYSYLQSDVSTHLTGSECDPFDHSILMSLFTPLARIIDNSIKEM